MAEKRISDLNNTTYTNSTDYEVIVQNDETKKIKKIDLDEYAVGGSTPENNQKLWYDTSNKILKTYNEGEWKEIAERTQTSIAVDSTYFNSLDKVRITQNGKVVSIQISLRCINNININYLSSLKICEGLPIPYGPHNIGFTGIAIKQNQSKTPVRLIISNGKLTYWNDTNGIEIYNGATLYGNVTYICN